MICNNCNQETEPGKFCTKCGSPLDVANVDESSATDETIIHQNEQAPTPPPIEPVQQHAQQGVQQPVQQGQQVDFAEKTKELSSNFGGFFLNALKKPSSAKNVNGTQFISGIIMIIAFSLVISVNAFVSYKKSANEFGSGDDIGFFDFLAVPFLKYVLLYAIIVGLIFAAVRVAQQDGTIQDILAKFGAYLVPFVLLYVLSIVFGIIDMTGLPFSAVGYLAMIGPVLVVPVLILSEKAVKGFDYVYTTIALVLLTYIAYRYVIQSVNSVDDFFSNLPW